VEERYEKEIACHAMYYYRAVQVRACPQCGKNVAFTLPFCNGCGRGLGDVEISYTNNVFTGFVYGIERV
jgi:hypothetical protein